VGDDREQARDPAAAAARLPSLAWRTARAGLADGPVLVQVPRRGYLPALACQNDRTPARCSFCSGPLAATSGHATRPAVVRPGGGQLDLPAVRPAAAAGRRGRGDSDRGGDRPRLPRRSGPHVGRLERACLDPADPALVIATPGAEPVAPGGYAAALLLDGWALLSRADLRVAEETFRRWANAVALVRPKGQIVVGADAAVPAVQALIRWDPAGHAARELADRAELRFPPAQRFASVTGVAGAVTDLLAQAELPAGTTSSAPCRCATGSSACWSGCRVRTAGSWPPDSRRRRRCVRPARRLIRCACSSIPGRALIAPTRCGRVGIMAGQHSAGIVLYRRGRAGVEVLLGHMGGPYWDSKDDGACRSRKAWSRTARTVRPRPAASSPRNSAARPGGRAVRAGRGQTAQRQDRHPVGRGR
jgi:hypothetical protein